MSLSDDAYRPAVVRRLEDAILAQTGGVRERIVFVAADGTPLLVRDGEFGAVTLDAATMARWHGRVDLVTHTHPQGTTLTDDDVAGVIALDAREINAFGPQIRYRLVRRAGGRGWPRWDTALATVREIDAAIRPGLLRRAACSALRVDEIPGPGATPPPAMGGVRAAVRGRRRLCRGTTLVADQPAQAPPAVAEPHPGDTRVGGGLPLRAYPNWDEARQVFVFHAAERDAGSSYDDVSTEAPTHKPSAARRLGAAALRLLRRSK